MSSDQLVGVQKILYHRLSRGTQQQTHIGSKLKKHLLSPPRRCAKDTSQHAELLKSQRCLPLSRPFTCDESFSDEAYWCSLQYQLLLKNHAVAALGFQEIQIQKVSKIPSDTKTISDIQFSPCFTIGQSNQKIVNVYSNDPFQLTVIRVTTPQALISRH